MQVTIKIDGWVLIAIGLEEELMHTCNSGSQQLADIMKRGITMAMRFCRQRSYCVDLKRMSA